ncbi:MAG: Flp family type IVb pilin [Gammaproteobacteria bacterium]
MTSQAIKDSVLKFIEDEEGLTIVEYAVAGSLITIALATAFTLLGGSVATQITGVCGAVKGGAC